MLRFEAALQQPNIARLVEDMNSTLPLLESMAKRGRPMEFGPAQLVQLGESLVGETRSEFEEAIFSEPWPLNQLAQFTPFPLLGGRVSISVILMAVALADRDNPCPHILTDRERDAPFLAWLVTHLIPRRRLWVYLSDRFVAEMTATSVEAPHGLISPLQLCLFHVRPRLADLAPVGGESFHRAFSEWLMTDGFETYDLFWAVKGRRLSARRRGSRRASAPALAPLGARPPETASAWQAEFVNFGAAFAGGRLVFSKGAARHGSGAAAAPHTTAPRLERGRIDFSLRAAPEIPCAFLISFASAVVAEEETEFYAELGGRALGAGKYKSAMETPFLAVMTETPGSTNINVSIVVSLSLQDKLEAHIPVVSAIETWRFR